MDFEFNINNYVKVKLNDKGIEILKDRHEELNRRLAMFGGKGFDKFKLRVDSEGYYKTQMWSLMEMFGESIGIGFECVFETNIICCDGKPLES